MTTKPKKYKDWVFPFKVRSEVSMTAKEWDKIKSFIHLITPLKDNYPLMESYVDDGGPTDHFPDSPKEKEIS